MNENLAVSTAQLEWVLENDSSSWETEEGLQEIDYNKYIEDNYVALDKMVEDRDKVMEALALLSAKECVNFEAPEGEEFTFRVNLLPCGIIRANKLVGRVGRLDLWFSENRNGIVGVTLVALISAFVSVLTSIILK